jgi:hypothetical protein
MMNAARNLAMVALMAVPFIWAMSRLCWNC